LFTSTVGYCGPQDKVVSFLCALDDDDRSTLSTNAAEKDEFLQLVSDTHYTQGGHKTNTKSQAIRWVRNAPTVSHDNAAIDKFGGIFIGDFVTNLLPSFTVKEFRQELSSCRDGRPCPSRVGRKVGEGCCTSLRGAAGSPSHTISPGPKPTSVPSGILIHPTVWSQYNNVTDSYRRCQWLVSALSCSLSHSSKRRNSCLIWLCCILC